MRSNWPAALVTALQSEVLCLATIWKVTRKDGLVLRFTDHDRDIILNDLEDPAVGPAREVYEAASSYTRTAIDAKDTMAVEGLDLEALLERTDLTVDSVLNSDQISDADLIAGKFDQASFEIYLLDWTDPDNTQGLLKKGWIGGIKQNDHVISAEFRSLKQALKIRTVDSTTQGCRADLFDSRCGLVAATYEMFGTIATIVDARTITLREKLSVGKVFDLEEDTDGDRINVKVNLNDAVQPDGSLTRDLATPDGSEAYPFEINSTTDFDNIRNDPFANYVFTSDVDFTAFGNFTPIPWFHGTIDGRGYELQNVTVRETTASSQPNAIIQFLASGGTIKRLGVVNPDVGFTGGSTTSYKGGFLGIVMGTVEDCYTDGGQVDMEAFDNQTGGFLGRLRRQASIIAAQARDIGNPGSVKRCYSTTNILNFSGSPTTVGGFLGRREVPATEEDTYFDSVAAGTSSRGGLAAGGFDTNPNTTVLNATTSLNEASYVGFDFANDWKINEAVDTPRHLDPGRVGPTDPGVRFVAVDLTRAGTYGASAVNWTADLPAMTAVVVSASLDGESFTTIASSGDPIPGLSASDPLNGVFVTIRVDFQTTGPNVPTLLSLDLSVDGETDAFVDDVGPPNIEPSDADWFVKGQVFFTSGLNEGLAMEIKDWTPGTRTVKLLLKLPFTMQVGDELKIYPGCRKRSAEDCGAKFANIENFRGEPFIPGQDNLLQVPGAQ